MASQKDYEHLEPAEDPSAAAAARAALETQVLATQEARRAELEAALAAERAEQERLREALKEAERVAAEREPPATPTAPPAWAYAAEPWDPSYARPQPVGAQPSAGQRDPRDAVDHVVGDGLAREQREQLAIGDAEASAGIAETAAREGSTDKRTEANGGDAHGPGMTFARESVNQERLDDLECEWVKWVDAKCGALFGEVEAAQSGEALSLRALALPEYESAAATDTAVFPEELLESLFTAPDHGRVYERRGPEALARWRAWYARRPPATEPELRALQMRFEAYVAEQKDFGSRVQLLLDRSHVFAGGDASAYARQYARSLPIGWNESIVISLAPKHHPVVCRWTETRVTMATTRHWAASLPDLTETAPSADNSPTLGIRESWRRFHVLRDHDFEGAERVIIPASQPVRGPVSLAELAAPPTAAPATRIHPTGIGPLDAALATGGIRTGARVVVQATTGSGKTVAMLETAESFAGRGLRVCWIATGDDDAAAIKARRRQRLGMSQIEALVSTDEHGLNPKLMVFDGRNVSLEQILHHKNEIDLLVLDPVSKVITACTSTDPVVRIGYALDLIEAAGVTTIMGVPTVRGASRRALNERGLGGQRVESGAHLLLELVRDGAALTLSIGKSRYGGEGLEIPLTLDAARQRVTARTEGSGAPSAAVRVEDRIWTDVQRVIEERGPRSVRALCEAVSGKTETKREVVRQRLAAGDLVQLGRNVGLRS